MTEGITITGVVETGNGMSVEFMRGFNYEALGYSPIPGTLNVNVGKGPARRIRNLPGGIRVLEEDRVVIFHPMKVAGFAVHGRVYQRTVELVAPLRLRAVLGVTDGDSITIEL